MTSISLMNYAISGCVDGLLIALPALALTLVMGIARFAHAGVGDYMTASAYGAIGFQKLTLVTAGWASLAALGTGVAISVLAGWLVFRKLREKSSVTSLVASIGVALLLRSVLAFFAGNDSYNVAAPLVRAWRWHGLLIRPTDMLVALIAIGAVAIVFGVLHFTPIGRRMRAVSNNPALARTCGINIERVYLMLWVMTGLLCGLGGFLYGVEAVVTPQMGWDLLVPAFTAMVVGGVGNPLGAVIAGVLLGIVESIAVPFVGAPYKLVISFLVLLLVLLFRPRGLLGAIILER